MTNAEAKEFWRQLMKVHFPGLHAWWESLPEPTETWGVWREALRPYSYDECMSVVRRWSDGTLKPFEQYERERVHLLIRAIIERDRSIQQRKAECQQLATPMAPQRYHAGAAAPVLAECIAMAKNGAPVVEIEDYLDSQCPTSPAYDQPSYQCLACYDRGHVIIWSPADVARWVSGHKPWPTCEVAIDCSCQAESQRVKYDPSKHCRIDREHTRRQAIEALHAWFVERGKLQNHSNYNHDFAGHA